MNQQINYIAGSIYVQLSIERPREIAPEEQLEAYYAIWAPLAPILGMPVKRIVERLKTLERDRDAFYQREVAPTMAARWADRLELRVAGRAVDFTLASSYRFGSTVRIDFTAPVSGVNRSQLQNFALLATQPLPVGSVANVKSMTLHYYTDHHNRRVESVPTTDDLIDPATGQPNSGGNLHIPITPWEAQDQRREIEDAVERLIAHLNSNLVYYHKVIWWLMDRDELYMLLDGFTAPYGRRFENGAWVEDAGRSIASVVERDPMAILGNTLVMRVAAGAFLGIDGHDSPDAAHRYYYDSQVRTDPLRVSLPTEGLYAQALMDKCEAAEEHHGSTDWVLTNGEPELETLADQLGTRRAAPTDLTPTQMPQSIINLQNAPAAPDPTGLAGILQAVTTSNAFRDMAGLAGTQANAMGALTQAASLAQSFGQMAVDFQKSKQGTADAKQKLSNIKKAQDQGLIKEPEAERQAARALDEQNMNSGGSSLVQDSAVRERIQHSGGQPLKVERQNQQGREIIQVGNIVDADDFALLGTSKKKTGPAHYGSPANSPSTNPDVAAALTVVNTFAAQTTPPKWKLSRSQVAIDLEQTIKFPGLVDQKGLNACGPAAFFRVWVERDPIAFANFAADLFNTGKAFIGGSSGCKVEPRSSLLNQDYQSLINKGEYLPNPAQWMVMCGLRDASNPVSDFDGTESQDWSGITTPGDIEEWLEATKVYSSVKEGANVSSEKSAKNLLGLPLSATTDVLLFVSGNFVKATGWATKIENKVDAPWFPNHIVVLKKATDKGTEVDVDVWSWAENYSGPISKSFIADNYWGAVEASV
jgi:hypothetical protein